MSLTIASSWRPSSGNWDLYLNPSPWTPYINDDGTIAPYCQKVHVSKCETGYMGSVVKTEIGDFEITHQGSDLAVNQSGGYLKILSKDPAILVFKANSESPEIRLFR